MTRQQRRQPSTEAEMIRYYDRRATEYEQIYYRDNVERRKEIDDEAARLQELATGRDVVDIACGTGYWTTRLAATAKQVTAVDRSIAMIREALKKPYRHPTSFVQADLNWLPLGDGQFDLTCLGFWFSHHPRQEYNQLFDLVRRLTASGGQIWLVDNNPSAEGPTMESTGRDSYGNNYKRRYLDNGTEFIILKNYFEQSELEKIFSEQFRIERLTYREYYWAVVLAVK